MHSECCSSLELVVRGLSRGLHLSLLGVELHQFGEIELGLLEDLHLADHDILKREDLVALLGDLLGGGVAEQVLEEVLQGGLGDLGQDDFHHLTAELLLLGALGVAGSLNLLLVAAGEGNSEDADKVAIEGLGLDEGLNEGVPLLDEGAKTIAGHIHAVEVGVAVEALDFLALEADSAPGLIVSVGVQVTEGDGEHTAAKGISGNLLTGGLVARGQGGHTGIENAGHMYVVPFFLHERMHNFLLLLALLLEVAGVLALGHCC